MKAPSMAASALLLAAVLLVNRVEATVVTTCRAAADSDKRVDYQFCAAQLGRQHDSPDADTWGLAKVATLVGVNNADLATDDIKNLEAKPTDATTKAALDQCLKLYNSVGFAFAGAHDELTGRNYATAKQRLGEAMAQTKQCEGAFAGTKPLLTARNRDSIQLAIIATAISPT